MSSNYVRCILSICNLLVLETYQFQGFFFFLPGDFAVKYFVSHCMRLRNFKMCIDWHFNFITIQVRRDLQQKAHQGTSH